ncbi:MAG: DNA topoisomerase IB [Janthinobacterium lividum]
MTAAAKKAKNSSAHETSHEPILDPVASARAAGLRYVTDRQPGLRRLKTATGFRYTDPEGGPVSDKETLARIKSLVIPPAWIDVWITKHPNGHLQATGRDARGRKQSRYHPRWRVARDETKYERMALFAQALPKIRERVEHDLARPGIPREKVLATIIRLMEETHIRVGNAEYARENQSYGLTTMRNKHVEIHGSTISFDFKGKSGVHHAINLQDKRLARIIKRCEEIPGYELFQFLDHDGNHHHIDSHDVNEYLREITGEHFTAKDFRTWAGSVLAGEMLRQIGGFANAKQAKKNVLQAITAVAAQLGNTPSVCRKCYVHPAVLEAYLNGHMSEIAKEQVEEIKEEIKEVKERLDDEIEKHADALHKEERALVQLLQQRLLVEAA